MDELLAANIFGVESINTVGFFRFQIKIWRLHRVEHSTSKCHTNTVDIFMPLLSFFFFFFITHYFFTLCTFQLLRDFNELNNEEKRKETARLQPRSFLFSALLWFDSKDVDSERVKIKRTKWNDKQHTHMWMLLKKY